MVVRHQTATDGTEKLLVEWGEDEERDEATQRRRDPENQGERRPDPEDAESEPASRRPISRLKVLDSSPVDERASLPQSECVMIPSLDPEGGGAPRRTACISSQVGCPVGCAFCASGLGGLEGNLSAGRIVEQVWLLNRLVGMPPADSGDALPRPSEQGEPRITHVVFMGMGEPLANFSSVVKAIRTLTAPWGMSISARRITVSTVGLPKAIERLAEQLDLPVTLALSLHAPNDALRRNLIPWAEYTTIAELLASCRKWFEKTGREITLEYTLLGGVNDKPEHAAELAQVARTLRANVNLIRYNEVAGMPFKRPATEAVRAFQRLLRARQVNTHIRRSRGRDIAAACGQLRHEVRAAG
jgi:23S rRNA (adenine2503-C2)-methyltransferase